MLFEDFLNRARNISDDLNVPLNEVYREWRPSEPPKTVMLSELGHYIVGNIDRFDPKVCSLLFGLIEEALRGEDAITRDAVATGLVESLVNASDGNDKLWCQIKSCLGPKSLRHAVAWKNFGS